MSKRIKGIFIQNVSMPKNGKECLFSYANNDEEVCMTLRMLELGCNIDWYPELTCSLVGKKCDCTTKPEWCPLHEVK